jgi:hypothetical protein
MRFARDGPPRFSIVQALMGLLVFASTACSGSLFKVKPVVDLPALPATAKTADAGDAPASLPKAMKRARICSKLTSRSLACFRYIAVAYQNNHAGGEAGTAADTVPGGNAPALST